MSVVMNICGKTVIKCSGDTARERDLEGDCESQCRLFESTSSSITPVDRWNEDEGT